MKVVYVILTCEAYLPTRGKAVRETCMKGADYMFLSSTPNESERVFGWNTSDDYDSCPKKCLAFFQNMKVDADWVVLIDDDTFVYRDRLETYLAGLDSSQKLYVGYSFKDDPVEVCMSGGAGICVSRSLYDEICNRAKTISNTTAKFSDEFLNALVRSIPDVRSVVDTRFHWKAAESVEQQKTAFTFHYACPSHMYSYFSEEKMDISILMPTMTFRNRLFQEVLAEIRRQAACCPRIRTEILWEQDNGELTLGQKRNVLMERCSGKYHCFIDDDDVLSPDYLKTFVPMITSGTDYDCASFVGAHYDKGRFNKLFYHSLDYTEWAESSERFIRTVSPMNLIKTEIVRQVRYKDIRNTEDHEFSKRLMKSGLLKTEYKIDPNKPIYHYIDGVKKDREEWKYSWNGDYIRLYKPFPIDTFTRNLTMPSSGNVVYSFLKIYK